MFARMLEVSASAGSIWNKGFSRIDMDKIINTLDFEMKNINDRSCDVSVSIYSLCIR